MTLTRAIVTAVALVLLVYALIVVTFLGAKWLGYVPASIETPSYLGGKR